MRGISVLCISERFIKKITMTWGVAVFIGFMALPHLEAKTEDDYWRETRVTWSDARQNLSQNNCYRTERHFLACVSALNDALSFHEPRLVLTHPDHILKNPEMFGPQRGVYGPLHLYEMVPHDYSELSSHEFYQQVAANRYLHVEMILRAFHPQTEFFPVPALNVDPIYVPFDQLTQIEFPQWLILEEDEALYAAASINAYLRVVADPHTSIMPTAQLMDIEENSGESYVGIGSYIEKVDDDFVLRPMEDSTALAVGLQPLDILIGINNTPIIGMSTSDIEKKLRGIEGSEIELTIQREHEVMSFKIERRTINIPNAQARLLSRGSIQVGYISLKTFLDPKACEQIKNHIMDLEQSGAQILILDLRSNLGGRADQTECIGGLFLGDKEVLYKVRNLSSKNMALTPSLTTHEKITDLPLITLINGHSASGSEIIAGSFQEYSRSWVLGELSFGKGTVQRFQYPTPFITLKQTYQQFYLPSGRSNQIVGIEPDFTFYLAPGLTEEQRFVARERDFFYDAIHHEESVEWVSPRLDQITWLTQCIENWGQAESLYNNRRFSPTPVDYQLERAIDLVTCLDL